MTTLVAERTIPEPENPRESEYVPDAEILATFWRQRSPGCADWRMFIPAKHLPGQVLYLNKDDVVMDGDEFTFPRQAGTSIWQFPGNTTRAILMAAMQELGHKVLVDVDDTYLMESPTMQFGGDWQVELDRSGQDKHSLEAHAHICKTADGVLCATRALVDAYSKLNKNVILAPNSVNTADWPEPEKPNDGILRIGWAASHSHLFDVPLVLRGLNWAARQKDVEVHIFGLGEIVDFGDKIKTIPWTNDLKHYKRSLALCDVHICPLVDTAWSRHKSDIKAIEGAMAGAMPIVSKCEPYKPWHDKTISCGRPRDWENALRWVVSHRDEVPKLAAGAKAYVLAERTIEKNIHIWREACA